MEPSLLAVMLPPRHFPLIWVYRPQPCNPCSV